MLWCVLVTNKNGDNTTNLEVSLDLHKKNNVMVVVLLISIFVNEVARTSKMSLLMLRIFSTTCFLELPQITEEGKRSNKLPNKIKDAANKINTNIMQMQIQEIY